MKKFLLLLNLAFLVLLFSTNFLQAQKKGEIHIKITDDGKKIDTVIEFTDNIDAEKIESIISTIAGENIEINVHGNDHNKMIWISGDDFEGDFDFNFDFDFDFDFDSSFKDFNTLMFDDLSDSMLLKHGFIRDSADNFIFEGDDEHVMKWHSSITVNGKNVFVFKGDTIYTDIDSVYKIIDNDTHIIMKHTGSDEDMEEIIFKIKSKKGKGGIMIMKTYVDAEEGEDGKKVKKVYIMTDDEDDEENNVYIKVIKDKDVIITTDENGKTKTIIIEIETTDDKIDVE